MPFPHLLFATQLTLALQWRSVDKLSGCEHLVAADYGGGDIEDAGSDSLVDAINSRNVPCPDCGAKKSFTCAFGPGFNVLEYLG